MKRHSHKLLSVLLAFLLVSGMFSVAQAQQKLIHYWHFDNFTGLAGPGSPSLIKPLHANWSSLDSTKATLSYVPAYAVSSKYQTYWDVVAGEASDTFNVKKGGKSGLAAGNNELRFRNPSDSMEALLALPTSHYKNITIKYGLERTGSGQGRELFDYSTDGGSTWKTSGLSVTSDSALPIFNLVTVSLSADAAVNDNASGFVFRIKFRPPNSASNGNNRVDNISVEGDSIGGVTPPPPAKKLVHYWHFNNFTGLSAAGSPSLIKPVHANWSTLDSTQAMIAYVPAYSTLSSSYQTWWDATTGDTTNARRGAAAGNCLRVRNPSDSMQLMFIMPTTHYKNINLKFALEKSSLTSGQGKQVFDYSVDSGFSWKTTGLSIKSDSVTNTTFNLITVDMSSDTTISNNPNFMFRLKFKTQNTATNGNNRFDNITVEGDTDTAPPQHIKGAGIEEAVNTLDAVVYPNPTNDHINIITGTEKQKTITVYNLQGQAVYTSLQNDPTINVSLSNLKSGIYILNIRENETGRMAIMKLIKN